MNIAADTKSSSDEKKTTPVGARILGIIQFFPVAVLYIITSVLSFMSRFSDDPVEKVEELIDILELKDIALNESLFLVMGTYFALIGIALILSAVGLVFSVRPLRALTLPVSVLCILSGVVFSALMIAFGGNKLFLLILIPLFSWFGGVLAYCARMVNQESLLSAETPDTTAVIEAVTGTAAAEKVSATVAVTVQPEPEIVRTVVEENSGSGQRTKEKKLKKVKSAPDGKGIPLGLKIIGGMHLVVLGIVNTIGGVINVFATFSEDYDILFQDFIRSLEIRDVAVSQVQLQVVFVIHILMAIAFLISGIGLLRKSDRFRKFTLYMIIGIAVFSVLSVLLQGIRAFNIFMILYFLWFGYVIFYLTRRKLDLYFH
jgi:hypothetical protein